MPKVDATQKAIIAELLNSDADLRSLATRFVRNGLVDLVNLQERGDPKIRAEIARALSAPITAAITEVGEDDTHASLRADMMEMMGEIMGQFVPEDAEGYEPPHHVAPKS